MTEKNLKQKPYESFTNAATYYVKSRPGYPDQIIELLKNKCGLKAGDSIADIGSGTGIFTQLLLENSFKVYAVEPNAKMREQAEKNLSNFQNFMSIDGTAESTGLVDHCVDGITCATAFHWFDRSKAKKEFKRILKNEGWCLLIWNIRLAEASPLMREYENILIKYGIGYKDAKAGFEKIGDDEVYQFFAPSNVESISFPNHQIVDLKDFINCLLSSSFIPKPQQPNYEKVIQAAKRIFEKYQRNNKVKIIYNTKCYLGYLE